MAEATLDAWSGRGSRAMGKAWSLNTVQDRALRRRLDTLDTEIRMNGTKRHILAANTKEFLQSINPAPSRNVVCPFGLSRDQADNFRLIKRGKLPSMTLEEFDEKWTEVKQTINDTRMSTIPGLRRRDRRLLEFKIKRRLFRPPDTTSLTSNTVTQISVVPDDHVTGSVPLYKRKSFVAGAYNRLSVKSTRGCPESAHSGRPGLPGLSGIRDNRSA